MFSYFWLQASFPSYLVDVLLLVSCLDDFHFVFCQGAINSFVACYAINVLSGLESEVCLVSLLMYERGSTDRYLGWGGPSFQKRGRKNPGHAAVFIN